VIEVALNITRDTQLEVTTDGSRLIIEPVRTEEKECQRERVKATT
jgi:virulence-associated protein VagC